MKKEDLYRLSSRASLEQAKQFSKQFKTGKNLNGFFVQLQKRGLEVIINGKLDAPFWIYKHEKLTTITQGMTIQAKRLKLHWENKKLQETP